MPVPPLDVELVRNLAIALFIGALVGIDRERRAAASPTFGGLRTFMLIALAGAVTTWLGPLIGMPWLVAAGLFALTALLVVAYVGASAEGPLGLTGEIAAVIVYLLGGVCAAGRPEMAVVLGVTTSALLAFKDPLHRLVGQVGPDDLGAALKLLFATFIVLPLLPDRPVDPLGVLNPYRLWWLVILISGLSLLGYATVRALGERRGMALTGIFGGLVSSTAVTVSSARRSREDGTSSDALAMSVLLAWGTMFARVLVLVAIVNWALLPSIAPPMIAMAAVSLAAAGWFGTRPDGESRDLAVPLRNPFSLWEAVKFGLAFAVVLVVVELGRRYLDERALYALAALAGAPDVNAITLSMAGFARTTLSPSIATGAIVIAAASNTLVKCGIAASMGSRELGWRVGWSTVAVCAVGGAALLV